MEIGLIINSAGLLLDIIGAILLFKFWLPEEISRSGAVLISINKVDEAEKQKAKSYDFWGKVGLVFLIIGFLLQLMSSFI